MRASRLLSILLSLQARGRLTASEMAESLEVSERTILRDIDELSASGIPVIGDRGRAGGFRLADGFRTQFDGIRDLLRLGADVEVLTPASVRAQLAKALRDTLKHSATDRAREMP